jgi:hypothetical protein
MGPAPAVFFSYAHDDDRREGGKLSQIRHALEAELSTLTGDEWHVFQDVEDIAVGEQWKKRLEEGLAGSTFFLPIITPTYLKRDACRNELRRFLNREQQLGRDDLVIPVLYINTPALSDPHLLERDALARTIAERQWHNWTDLRPQSFETADARKRLGDLAKAILEAYARGGRLSAELATEAVIALDASEVSTVNSSRQPKVVFPLHGIRTHAEWIRAFSQLAAEHDWQSREASWNFGRFSLLGFLSPWGRASKEQWFVNTYVQELDVGHLNLNSERLPSLVAHSFGCYLVGYAMLKYDGLRFNKIILCGSILPTDFPWDDLLESGRVRSVRNEFGIRDPWVKLVRHFVRGSGSSGARGIAPERQHPRLEQKKFVFNHAEYFVRAHMKSWIDFLEREEAVSPGKAIDVRWPKPRPPILLYVLVAAVCFSVFGAIHQVTAHWKVNVSITRVLARIFSKPTPSPSPTPSRPPVVSSIDLKLNWVEPLGLWVAEHEVTQAQLLAVMGELPGYYKGDRRPADRVTLALAEEFCRRLTFRDQNAGLLPAGYVYRLPMDLEYDIFVADAGLEDAITSEKTKRGKTEDVGSSPPNKYGLYDVRGNVWEWMSEGVLRGACWDNYDAKSLELEYRLNPNPQYHGENFGFRCVLAPKNSSN